LFSGIEVTCGCGGIFASGKSGVGPLAIGCLMFGAGTVLGPVSELIRSMLSTAVREASMPRWVSKLR
jgi:hypothetical protein